MLGVTLFRIVAGVALAFVFFPTGDYIMAWVGLKSPLVPVLGTTVIAGLAIKRSIVADSFPLIGIGFYVLMGWMIGWTDMTEAAYPNYYGQVLLFVASISFVIWAIHVGLKRAVASALDRTPNQIVQLLISLAPIAVLIYVIHSLRQLRTGLRFGLTGTLGIGFHVLLIIASIDFPPLLGLSFGLAAFGALIPFYGRVTTKEFRATRQALDQNYPNFKSRFKPSVPVLTRPKLRLPSPGRPFLRNSKFTIFHRFRSRVFALPKRAIKTFNAALFSPVTKGKAIFHVLRRK